jgi:hypothetical protein
MSDWLFQAGSEWLRVARFGRIDEWHAVLRKVLRRFNLRSVSRGLLAGI